MLMKRGEGEGDRVREACPESGSTTDTILQHSLQRDGKPEVRTRDDLDIRLDNSVFCASVNTVLF